MNQIQLNMDYFELDLGDRTARHSVRLQRAVLIAMQTTVLYVIHLEHWTDSRIVDVLRDNGYQVELRCHAAGDPLPEDASGYRGVVLAGGIHSVGAADQWPYLTREIAWTRRVVEAGTPFLGMCLGSQILAHAFGGQVAARPDGRCEFGFYPITPTPAGRPLFDGLTHVYQSHHESCVVPPDSAELLASSISFATQAFRIGDSAFGVQFHPDAKLNKIADWVRDDQDNLTRPGAQSEAEQLRLAPLYEAEIQSWTERFIDHWLAEPVGVAVQRRPRRASPRSGAAPNCRTLALGKMGLFGCQWSGLA